MVRALGLNPEEILTKDALAKPHRTVVAASVEPNYGQRHIDILMKALKQRLREEITAEMRNAILQTV